MATWTQEREDRLKAMWQKVSVREMAENLGTSAGSVYRQARKLGLKTKNFRPHPLRKSHPAVLGGRPKFTHAIYDAETSPGLLIRGRESRKIGPTVLKGAWAGMPIFTLTLAERLTCPRSCAMWEGCYGNQMNWARRHRLDRALIERLRWELTGLAARWSEGFVVRPHVLGDFGSDDDIELALEYVAAWHGWMERFENLRIFGYTAHPPETPVGRAIMAINVAFPNRCRIRFSGRHMNGFGAMVVEEEADSQHVLCPFETGRTPSCAACALCWTMDKTVEFVRH